MTTERERHDLLIQAGAAIDQTGQRWLIFQKNGFGWAFSADPNSDPMLRCLYGGDEVEADPQSPDWIRTLEPHWLAPWALDDFESRLTGISHVAYEIVRNCHLKHTEGR